MSTNVFDGYISAAEYARQRGVSLDWLRKERREGRGAPFVKVGHEVLYEVAGIRAWLEANTVRPEQPKMDSNND